MPQASRLPPGLLTQEAEQNLIGVLWGRAGAGGGRREDGSVVTPVSSEAEAGGLFTEFKPRFWWLHNFGDRYRRFNENMPQKHSATE